MFKKAIATLFKPQHNYLPGTELFRQIDVPAQAKELKLSERGAEDGERDYPGESESAEPSAEADVRRYVLGVWDDMINAAGRALESYRGRYASQAVAAEIDTVLGQPQSIAADLQAAARAHRPGLDTSIETYREAHKEFDRFRQQEKLTRPVEREKSAGLKAMLLIIAFGLELAVNTSVFAGADEFGLAGALLKVIAIPCLNLSVCFFLVFFAVRQLLRRSALRRLVGVIGVLALCLFAGGFNLAVAHWRDGLQGALSFEAGQQALARMLASPFGLNDLNSWMLFAVGLLAAAFAALDGWIWHDAYPGYSRRHKAREKARQNYVALREDADRELQEIAGDALGDLRDQIARADNASNERRAIAELTAHLVADAERYRRHLQEVATDLVGIYREANRKARKTPPPAAFEANSALDFGVFALRPIENAEGEQATGALRQAHETIAGARQACAESLPELDVKGDAT